MNNLEFIQILLNLIFNWIRCCCLRRPCVVNCEPRFVSHSPGPRSHLILFRDRGPPRVFVFYWNLL